METIRKAIQKERDMSRILRSRCRLCSFWNSLNSVMLNLGVVILVIGVVSCTNKTVNDQEGETRMTTKTIEEVLKEHTEELMSLPGVVGTAQGICNDKPCIKVYVVEKTPELDQKIPDILEGYPVVMEESGEIRALPKDR